MADFPNVAAADLPIGTPGMRSSNNPIAAFATHGNKLFAGVGGVTVGRFAWVDGAGVVLNAGTGLPSGFVVHSMQAIITEFRGSDTMIIPEGRQVSVLTRGDFYTIANNAVTVGQAVFASLTTGEIRGGAPAAVIAGYIELPNWRISLACGATELTTITPWSV